MQPGSFLSLLAWFVAIVALIPLALWLLKRTPLGGAGGLPGTPRTVAVLPLAAHGKLVTVEVGTGAERQWLVLGVTQQGIRTLHTMAAIGDAPPPALPPAQATFAQLLSRMQQPRRGGGRAQP